MCESEVKAAMTEIINDTAAQTLFQDIQSYITFLFSEWRIILRNYFPKMSLRHSLTQ